MAGGSGTLLDRFKQEPLVPLGAAATFAAFLYAAHGMYRGNFKQTQWGMRSRVVLQGLTVCALVGYGLYSANGTKPGRKEDVRDIDWERLARESMAAEEADKLRKEQGLAAQVARAKQARTVFAPEPKDNK
ncbi:Respiratory supercomplex factor 1, mitochondrial [Coemansia aciculifera]|uniref:Respiratory supercomplex factor 1, mitochondrial n=1 Tax=Coemansia aciculifera TaxID=417176 RepID=A0ACC1LZV8_9FUNG|nr:Respiratory supercomplex factor 1, mitochondrial [Coemansia aciculifera]KAJ2901423.1 Respiratory supercomplex factor 1, mitochondrial [Coemansia aciculifera]